MELGKPEAMQQMVIVRRLSKATKVRLHQYYINHFLRVLTLQGLYSLRSLAHISISSGFLMVDIFLLYGRQWLKI